MKKRRLVTLPETRFVLDLLELKDRAARLELWRTTHAIDEATRAVGWELARNRKARYSGADRIGTSSPGKEGEG